MPSVTQHVCEVIAVAGYKFILPPTKTMGCLKMKPPKGPVQSPRYGSYLAIHRIGAPQRVGDEALGTTPLFRLTDSKSLSKFSCILLLSYAPFSELANALTPHLYSMFRKTTNHTH